jgi:predicted RNase H-like HicB family nuclease
MKYAIVIERGEEGYGAYVLDLPGCIAAGDSETEVRTLIREAIGLHLEALREQGSDVPAPSTLVDYVEVPTAA